MGDVSWRPAADTRTLGDMPLTYHNMNVSGPRTELVEELLRSCVGWLHIGRADLSEQARDGAFDLQEKLVDNVQVGHIVYTVTDL